MTHAGLQRWLVARLRLRRPTSSEGGGVRPSVGLIASLLARHGRVVVTATVRLHDVAGPAGETHETGGAEGVEDATSWVWSGRVSTT